MAISAPFSSVLAAGRPQFNTRVVEAKRRFPAFDSEAFSHFLTAAVDPVIMAVAARAPDRVAPTVLALYELALELVGLLLGGSKARDAGVHRTWQEALPAYAALVAEHPKEVAASMTNAIVHLSKFKGARAEQWVGEMTRLAPLVSSLAQLQLLGQVLAWRSGLAHFRAGALQAADQLPEALALAAVSAQEGTPWSVVRERLAADPWWDPALGDRAATNGIEVGTFAGLGGMFAQPPQLRVGADGFIARSGPQFFLLTADAFGAVLHAATEAEFDAGQRPARAVVLKGNRLDTGTRSIELDLPADRLAVVSDDHTAAITSPYTHSVRLVPL